MRVGIIGIGGVGEACAHLLASRGVARTLVLANRSIELADAVRMDLEQSRSWTTPLSARAVVPWREGAFRDCEVLVLTAGPRLRGTESRAQKAAETARLLLGGKDGSIVEGLTSYAQKGKASPVLLVVTNPVEATVTWLAERTGWDRNRIIGLGTTVETARFSRFLADALNVDATSVWTEIVGEHGPMVDILDREAVERRVTELGGSVDLDSLLERTRQAAADIRLQTEQVGARSAKRFVADFNKKTADKGLSEELASALETELAAALSPPATRFAIAAAALEVVEAIGNDRGRVLTVSGFSEGAIAPDVALALPFIVGRAGIISKRVAVQIQFLKEVAESVAQQVQAMRSA